MEQKDPLKEILDGIDQVHESVDLEHVILKTIKKQDMRQLQIERYKSNGIRAMYVSSILTVILAILFSMPDSVLTIERSIVTFSATTLVLLILFVQVELGKSKVFNH